MATATDLKQAVEDLKREVGENKALLDSLRAKVEAGIARIEELMAQDVSDAEMRTAIEEIIPALREQIGLLDAEQPVPPPEG